MCRESRGAPSAPGLVSGSGFRSPNRPDKGRNPTDRAGSRREVWCERPACYHRRQLAGAIWGISAKTSGNDGDPSMSKSQQKSRERFWVDRLREVSRMAFEIDDPREKKEKPDFLLRYEGRAIGLEVAELQIDQRRGSSRGSGLQREASLRRQIVSRAQKSYFAAPSSRINAKVYFRPRPRQSLVGFDRRELAESISGALRQLTLDPFENIRLDLHSNPSVPMPVGFVHVCGIPDGITPRWQVIDPGWSRELEPSDVEPILEKKNGRLPEYQKTVNENWLLIVADGCTPAGMFRRSSDGPSHLPASNFDRTFLLCEPDRFFYEWP